MARDVITSAGYGDNFGHGLGHAVGLDIHETPRFSRLADKGILPAGAVMTVEPGIYLPGWGGVRIEDLIVLTDGAPRILSAAPKEPIIPL
jgi:Xaa-Pro aminopeptidase